MKNNSINNKFESLPIEAQKQVMAFIDFLQKKYEIRKKRSSQSKPDITKQKFIGIWKDREDMRDSSLWIRKLRRTEWGNIVE